MKIFRFNKLLFLVLFISTGAFSQQIIQIKHTTEDLTSLVRQKIEGISSKDVKLVFEKGVYNFERDYAQNKYCAITNHGNGNKRIVFRFENLNSIEIEGNGSEFVFSGQVAPFQFEKCKSITVKNLTIDWDIPFSFQGDITKVNEEEHWYEMKPYTKGYSWSIFRGQLQFPNSNHFNYSSLGNTLSFDKETKQVAYGALDMSVRSDRVEKRPNGILRFYNHQMKRFPKVGKVLHSKGPHAQNRYAPAFQTKNSSNALFDNVTIHHALGMGFLFERTEDIKIVNSGIYIREGSDRAISTTADATHFANCKGDILIENCRFEGMLDDGTNVHGTYVEVDKIINKNTVRVALMHYEQPGFQFADVGDEIWFIKAPDPTRKEVKKVVNVTYVNDVYADITFDCELPADVKLGDILENKTWNPVFTMRGCVIRDHRARNIIIKTPKRIIIENNDLSSMMSSIMLRGESFHWFESGSVEDVIIRNNRFIHCAYGGAKGHAVLKVSPRLGKKFDDTILYDRNILFEKNHIETFDNCIIWADRVDGLIIRKNTIIQTDTEKPQYPNQPVFYLKNSKDVLIEKNNYKGNVSKYVEADAITQKTLTLKKNKGIKNE